MNLQKLAGSICVNLLLCALVAPMLTGCAALTSLVMAPGAAATAPEAPRSITTVKLSQANYHVQRLNVTGHDNGFILLEIFTIVPPSRVKAITRMYQSAHIQPGGPLAPANIAVEELDQNFILFSIPQVFVRADFVVFEPPPPNKPQNPPPQ